MAGPSKLVNGIICDELAFIRHPHTQNYNLESKFSDFFFLNTQRILVITYIRSFYIRNLTCLRRIRTILPLLLFILICARMASATSIAK